MKTKTVGVALLSMFIVLLTSVFGYANYEISSVNFPYFHLGCLIIGGMIIVSLKTKYDELHFFEAACSFALYTIMVTLFTPSIVLTIKNAVE